MKKENQVFNMRRFGLCFKQYVGENWRRLLLQACVIAGTLTIVAVCAGLNELGWYRSMLEDGEAFKGINDSAINNEMPFFIMLLMGFGAISASLAFSSFGSKEGRIRALVSPFSQLEKYLTRWLIYIPGFLLVFFASAYIADAIRVISFSLLTPYSEFIHFIGSKDIFDFNSDTDGVAFNIYVFTFLFVQSIFMLGSSVWPKNSLIKTFGVGALVMFVYFMIGLVSALTDTHPNGIIRFHQTSQDTVDLFAILVKCGVSLIIIFNYVICYLRFKEMEVINRW